MHAQDGRAAAERAMPHQLHLHLAPVGVGRASLPRHEAADRASARHLDALHLDRLVLHSAVEPALLSARGRHLHSHAREVPRDLLLGGGWPHRAQAAAERTLHRVGGSGQEDAQGGAEHRAFAREAGPAASGPLADRQRDRRHRPRPRVRDARMVRARADLPAEHIPQGRPAPQAPAAPQNTQGDVQEHRAHLCLARRAERQAQHRRQDAALHRQGRGASPAGHDLAHPPRDRVLQGVRRKSPALPERLFVLLSQAPRLQHQQRGRLPVPRQALRHQRRPLQRQWHPLRACDPRGQAALQVAARDARGTSRASLPREFGGAARPA
mmetsp:Transcript_12361/g.26433  ORF Transcript_12361/g.26433 Transcript_12361/m.26433 type:complete len:325 (-) Transcript_12361:74-1048(-)